MGLANPHLEPFEFGRGWQLDHISVAMTEPRYMPLIAYADAWSPPIPGAVTGRTVYIGDKTAEQIHAMAGQLRGAIVLTHFRKPNSGSRPAAAWSRRTAVQTGNPGLPGHDARPRSTI